MTEEILQIKTSALKDIESANNLNELNDVRIKYLGKKGSLTAILRSMGTLSKEERPIMGQKVNEARGEIEDHLTKKQIALNEKKLEEDLRAEKIDITLAGRRNKIGHLHPLTITLNKIKTLFRNMGYSVAEGPQIESDYYNFEALNLPKDHPARDMQDSFYITEEILMRSQTSPVQVRTMEKHKDNEPIRIIAPGQVYRRDDYDATHSPMFTQVEGLCIDKNISFADLKGTLTKFLKEIFGENVKVRFRPSFFPFTEPSAEVDISCVMCKGEGCRVCKSTGWLEILGAGMVHPNVLKKSGYDPEVVSGFAFGMGVERIAMLIYGIDDLRLFYDNDVRFLRQY